MFHKLIFSIMANFNWLDQWRDVGRKVGHSPFSLDKKQGFGLPNSQIVPIHFIDTVPGDHFQINLNGLMRTKTLNTAAFFGGKMFVNVFFVPYSQLWHPFNQFISQKVDKHSTQFRGSAYAPVVDLFKVAKFIVMYKDVTDEFGFRLVDSIVKLFQFAKIKNFYPLLMMLRTPALASDVDSWIDDNCTVGADKVHIKVNIFRLLAYQHIYYDYFRNKIYDDHPYYVDISTTPLDYVDTFNVDDLSCTSVSDNEIPITLGLRDRSDNYFNDSEDARIANIFKLHYHQYRKDVFTSLMPSTQFGAVSGIGFDLEHQHSVNGDSSILLTEYDSGRWKDNLGAVAQGSASIGVATNPSGTLFQPSVEGQPTLKHDHAYYVNNISDHLATGKSLTDAYMNVLDWRRAELLQQWKQNALRAGNMVDDNFEAHYGVKPYYEDDNNVRFLGGFEARLDINAVVANASTGESVNGNVGDIAGIGIGTFNGRPIDVQIKDFGVIVACASFVSDAYYNADGTDKSNTKVEPFDFFNKEFENVGFDSIPLSIQNSNLGSYSQLNMGYTPPFTEYKTDIDEVYGSFMDTISMYNGSAILFRGDMRDWVATRRDFEKSNYVSFVSQYGLFKTRFYQSPALTNNIFESAYDGTIVTDPFSFNLSWDIKAIRPMTVLGIPVFA